MSHTPVHQMHMKSHHMNTLIDIHTIYFLHRSHKQKNRTVWTSLKSFFKIIFQKESGPHKNKYEWALHMLKDFLALMMTRKICHFLEKLVWNQVLLICVIFSLKMCMKQSSFFPISGKKLFMECFDAYSQKIICFVLIIIISLFVHRSTLSLNTISHFSHEVTLATDNVTLSTLYSSN